MVFSLRFKITVALFVTGLLSASLVWAVAQQKLLQRFNEVRTSNASKNFRDDVAAYWRVYGSWDQGVAIEPFGQFERRRRTSLGVGLGQGNPATAGRGSEMMRPLRRFLLFTPQGRILNATPPYNVGDQVSAEDRKSAAPVEVDGQVVAYAAQIGHPIYTQTEQQFLDANQEALIFGTIAAAILAAGLGLVLGTRLSHPLRRLTKAIGEMGAGALRQQVPVGSGDEVGTLARAFNAMSIQLADKHDALQESHRKISEQTAMLEELAYRDSLTGLYNRRHFEANSGQFYAQANRYGHPLSLMVGDIDGFKQINDRFSHAIGDKVLQCIGTLLKEHLRATDLAARYGGEEFVAAFPHTSLTEAMTLCERLRQRIETYPWCEIAPDLHVTISIGICDDLTLGGIDAMLKRADQRLYQAKAEGRNRVCPGLTAS
jgi:diguanylate cyclase (GGDEF)-like protein